MLCKIIFERMPSFFDGKKYNSVHDLDYVRVDGKTLLKHVPIVLTERKDGRVYGQKLVKDSYKPYIDENGNKDFTLVLKNFNVKDLGNRFICGRRIYYFEDSLSREIGYDNEDTYVQDLVKMIDNFRMRKYWVSWRQYTNKWESANNPIGTSIENVWCSGTSSRFPLYHNVCAVVVGTSQEDATKSILADWPEATRDDWRFFDEKPIDWSPVGGRFS